MNPIKEFFKKKAAERKFKSAGPAHKLSESESKNQSSSSTKSSSSQKAHQSSQPHKVSKEAERAAAAAAAAALDRIQQQKQPMNWSSQAIKNQAKKELALENSLKEKSQPKQVVHVEQDCPDFTVAGVFFTCPMVGPEILPKDAIRKKIREFLYEQLEQEKGLAASLMIHTLNKNKSKVQKGVETLARYLTNVIDQPAEEKFRKIRLKNKAFQDRVVDLEGAFEFLTAAGFNREMLKVEEEEEEFFVLQDENLDIEKLQYLKEALLSAEPILPVLDRNLKVLKPADFVENVNLPKEFFNLTVDEIKKEQESRSEQIELMTQLRTKAMREKDEIRERHIYKYSLIRVKFPDGIILQGTFSVYEKFSAVREFVAENLADHNLEFDLLLPGGNRFTDESQSLLDLKLIPAVVLNFLVSDENNLTEGPFLNTECLTLLSDL